jgi:hypothetical protein
MQEDQENLGKMMIIRLGNRFNVNIKKEWHYICNEYIYRLQEKLLTIIMILFIIVYRYVAVVVVVEYVCC